MILSILVLAYSRMLRRATALDCYRLSRGEVEERREPAELAYHAGA
jgi:hypothetical protein